jgi:hypothetical protein
VNTKLISLAGFLISVSAFGGPLSSSRLVSSGGSSVPVIGVDGKITLVPDSPSLGSDAVGSVLQRQPAAAIAAPSPRPSFKVVDPRPLPTVKPPLDIPAPERPPLVIEEPAPSADVALPSPEPALGRGDAPVPEDPSLPKRGESSSDGGSSPAGDTGSLGDAGSGDPAGGDSEKPKLDKKKRENLGQCISALPRADLSGYKGKERAQKAREAAAAFREGVNKCRASVGLGPLPEKGPKGGGAGKPMNSEGECSGGAPKGESGASSSGK